MARSSVPRNSMVGQMRRMQGGQGQGPITFREGGLHETTGTPMGERIPARKMQAALAGRYGKKGAKQARMAKGMLAKGRRTAARNRRRRKEA